LDWVANRPRETHRHRGGDGGEHQQSKAETRLSRAGGSEKTGNTGPTAALSKSAVRYVARETLYSAARPVEACGAGQRLRALWS
jgi:hypothetical protein